MSRHLTPFGRASLAIATLLMACGALSQAHAADASMRVAMACTHGSDANGCKPAPMSASRHSAQAPRTSAEAKAPARRAPATRTVAAISSDGSRFQYDSCGCSN